MNFVNPQTTWPWRWWWNIWHRWWGRGQYLRWSCILTKKAWPTKKEPCTRTRGEFGGDGVITRIRGGIRDIFPQLEVMPSLFSTPLPPQKKKKAKISHLAKKWLNCWGLDFRSMWMSNRMQVLPIDSNTCDHFGIKQGLGCLVQLMLA